MRNAAKSFDSAIVPDSFEGNWHLVTAFETIDAAKMLSQKLKSR